MRNEERLELDLELTDLLLEARRLGPGDRGHLRVIRLDELACLRELVVELRQPGANGDDFS